MATVLTRRENAMEGLENAMIGLVFVIAGVGIILVMMLSRIELQLKAYRDDAAERYNADRERQRNSPS